METVSARC